MCAQQPNQFEEANREKQSGLLSEFFAFLGQNKKFWLIPLLLALMGIGALLILGGTAAAPFIYTLF
jgi:hypothetical protein